MPMNPLRTTIFKRAKPYPILTEPDPLLRHISHDVTVFDSDLHEHLNRLYASLKTTSGIAIASPQVGDLRRVVLVDIPSAPHVPPIFINPCIVEHSDTMQTVVEEGCLSVIGQRHVVPRYAVITVEALDKQGKPFTTTLKGLAAVCLQHEIDHLDGILFTDHIQLP